jgi:hypothetical protein
MQRWRIVAEYPVGFFAFMGLLSNSVKKNKRKGKEKKRTEENV